MEALITRIYSDLVDLEDVYQIETSSLRINFYKIKSAINLEIFNFSLDPSFQLPVSICNLAKNCAKYQFLTFKVII
jgi:hypothetical protein